MTAEVSTVQPSVGPAKGEPESSGRMQNDEALYCSI